MTATELYDHSSFRDPAGKIFIKNNTVYRSINSNYIRLYQEFKNKGLYKHLIEKKLLIPHTEISFQNDELIIQPLKIPFISYPYEWSFSQLQSAALLTLKIQYEVLKFIASLKDVSAYTVQLLGLHLYL